MVSRAAWFMHAAGLLHYSCMSDREASIVAIIEAACAKAGRKGIPVKTDDALI